MAQDSRTERLLAVLVLQGMKDSSQKDKILQLSIAGFTNFEIADLLQTTTGSVSQSLHEARKKSKAKTRATAKKAAQ